jgi:hypothetical protein
VSDLRGPQSAMARAVVLIFPQCKYGLESWSNNVRRLGQVCGLTGWIDGDATESLNLTRVTPTQLYRKPQILNDYTYIKRGNCIYVGYVWNHHFKVFAANPLSSGRKSP